MYPHLKRKECNFGIIAFSRYHNEDIYAKVDDMTYYPVNSMLVGGGGGGSTGAGNSTNYQHLHRRSNATAVTGATGQSGTSGVVVGGGGGIMSAADGRSTMSSAHMQHIHHPT